ncbi:hypothetical protein GOODEAATRI_006568, partial [Goodea atripinnis]
ERCPVVLAPLLYPEKRDIPMDRILADSGDLAKTIMESSLADFIQEVGYGFCARNIILQYGLREVTASQVARVLGMMARTHSGLSDGIPLQHSLMNPDVFCFADYPCHTVVIDLLKAPPEDDNREIATWYRTLAADFIHKVFVTSRRKSLDLVESLLRLSEVGQYEQVKQLFNFPIKHCPDMLVLALLQISTSWHTSVSQELSETILTMVANRSNVMNKARQPPPGVMPKGRAPSTSSLDAISPVQMDTLTGISSLSLGSTATSHTQSMQCFATSLSSALSNPLSPSKAFPPLPNPNPSTPFGVHSTISSQLPGMDSGIGSSIGSSLGMSSVSTDPFGTRKMSTPGLNPPTFQQSKMKASDLSQVWPEANQHFSKEIDDEANSYFQRIYNHPPHPTMSVDEVLEMLQRFKDSTIKREREVFNCMLRNLFEEYRFFPQYPDKELHITACLFGGIIEKGLVTYMALGLALRYVLEALRKPFGSKIKLSSFSFCFQDLELKSLLLEAYVKGQQELLYVVPFVAKVLESSLRSMAHPQLKQCVRQSVERAVQELVHPVVDRSIKIAMTTCEQIIRKDFALDSEESRMRVAAHHMMRNLTAGMAMITCREPLLMSIATNLKNSFAAALRLISVLMWSWLKEFELRKHARQEGRRYCDPVVLTYQAERMPEQIRLKAWATDDVAQIYDKCITDLEQHLHAIPSTLTMNPLTLGLRNLLEAVVLARTSRDGIAALGLLQKMCNQTVLSCKAVEGLLDATSGADADLLLRYRECHLLVLKALQDGRAYGPQWCNKQITRLPQLMDVVRSNYEAMIDRAHGGPNFMMHSGISQASEYDDPPGLREKAEYLLREWVNLYHSAAAGRDSTKAFSAFVGQMHQQGILKTDDLITRFFRLCTEMCVEISYRAQAEQQHNPAASVAIIRAKCYHNLDAFVRLIALLVKHSGEATNTVTKINLLNKVLGIVVGVLIQDHDVRHTDFQQLPYHRIFIMLLLELNAPEHVLETINFQTLTAFCNTFHILRPTKAPGFVYAWLELISHRIFIARMLAHTPQQKGTLRVLLVLLHDFPEFLCDYHYGFCDVIPPNCIQLRNLILSAFPRNMRLPDPFTPNLKVDMLSEINIAPRILTNFTGVMPSQFKKDLDSYLKTRSPVTFLSELRSNLQVGPPERLLSLGLLHLKHEDDAIAHIHNKGSTPSMSTITHSAHMDIFQNLAVDLDTEGRYLFLNAIANQLRYPNSHTHYFSCTMLYLFAEANTEAIQEQITRVLLERLIVNRPHPWGLLITFIELIKNPAFKFWSHDFVHCAPEIEKLFQSVAQCCMGQKQAQQVMEGTEQNLGLGELQQSVQDHLLSKANLQRPPLSAAQSFKSCLVLHQQPIALQLSVSVRPQSEPGCFTDQSFPRGL